MMTQLGSFVILRGSVPVLLRNPIFLCFPGGGGVRTPCPPPLKLDPRMGSKEKSRT